MCMQAAAFIVWVVVLQNTLDDSVCSPDGFDDRVCGTDRLDDMQSQAILLSSDDDDESAGLVAGAKRWWGSGAKVKQPPR